MYLKKIEEAKAILKSSSGKGIQAVLDTTAELLGNPMVLVDLSYNLLAHTRSTVADDPLFNELVSTGRFSHETVNFFNSEKFIEAFAKSDCVVLLKSSALKYNRATIILYDSQGMQLGSICVVACNREFQEIDYCFMKLASKFVSKELQKNNFYSQITSSKEEILITNLIEGNERDISLIDFDRLYQGLKKNIYVAVIDIMKYDNSLTHLVYFRDLFASIKGDFHYYLYLNNIVAILSTDQPILGIKRELKELNSFFEENNIYAGISDSFQNFNDLREYFKQALHALNFGMEMNYGKNIFMFADFRLEAFIKDYSDQVFKLCHPVVFYMYKYDIENNTNYKDILYSYLLAGRDVQRAAKVAKIEISEFAQKLVEVEDIFEIDFSNMNTVFGMFCCMKLQEYFPEKFLDA